MSFLWALSLQYVSCLSISVHAYMWLSMCYPDCRRLTGTIWLLEKHLHLWGQSSTCCGSQQYGRLSKSLESREKLSQTQTDSFWCVAMKPVGDLWPHPNMRFEKLEEKTFHFYNFFHLYENTLIPADTQRALKPAQHTQSGPMKARGCFVTCD